MGLFGNYASTSAPSNLKGKLKPIVVVDLQSNVFNKLKTYLEENHFEDIEANEQYYDLYGVQNNFEYSFIVTRVEGRSIIEISVYKDSRRGSERRKLKKIYFELIDLFKNKM